MDNVFSRSSFFVFFSSFFLSIHLRLKLIGCACALRRHSKFEQMFNTIIYYFIIMYLYALGSTKATRLTLINEFRLTSSLASRSCFLISFSASIFNRPLSNSMFGMTGKKQNQFCCFFFIFIAVRWQSMIPLEVGRVFCVCVSAFSDGNSYNISVTITMRWHCNKIQFVKFT